MKNMSKAILSVFLLFVCTGIFAQQPVVAVAPFDAISGISSTDANMITRVFFIRLGNTNKVSLVDRNVVDRVLREHRFQAGDWSNQQKTAELGKALNTDWIVRGELETFGSNILVTVQFYDIQTFRFMGGADLLLSNAAEAMEKMDPLVNKLIDTIAGSTTHSKTYKIGEAGPGGGIIFAFEVNTYLEVSRLLGEYTWEDAILIAKDFRGGGFSDWYLPSRDELNSIYQNLHKSGIINIGTGFYWSSSQFTDNTAYGRFFESDYATTDFKRNKRPVRAVRAFNF